MTVRLVAAGPRDVATMLDVMNRAFDPRYGEAWSGTQLIGALSLADAWAELAFDDDTAVGFALTRRSLDESELLLVAVVPERRGQGIGRRLLTSAAETAYDRGARVMFLEVRANNEQALHLYETAGFITVGYRKDYYLGRDNERFDAITMRRDLKSDSKVEKTAS